jgi:SAM-dependent methyltransferase
MKLIDAQVTTERSSAEVLTETLRACNLDTDTGSFLEIGCGAGEMTKWIAQRWPGKTITALDVDKVQLQKNLQANTCANIQFQYGAAQALSFEDAKFDAVFLFRSLHHVPMDVMDQALTEILRVLRPTGIAYFCEPVFDGDLNEIVRLFNDEERMRQSAFDAIVRACADSRWSLLKECHYVTRVRYADFSDFEKRMMYVSHSDYKLDEDLVAKVRKLFQEHAAKHGPNFVRPMRVDVLQKVSVAH